MNASRGSHSRRHKVTVRSTARSNRRRLLCRIHRMSLWQSFPTTFLHHCLNLRIRFRSSYSPRLVHADPRSIIALPLTARLFIRITASIRLSSSLCSTTTDFEPSLTSMCSFSRLGRNSNFIVGQPPRMPVHMNANQLQVRDGVHAQIILRGLASGSNCDS